MTSTEMAFELPETLPEDLPALEELRSAAVAELEKLAPADGQAPSQEVLDEMRRLDEAITALDAKIAEVAEAEAARSEEASAIAERAFGSGEADQDDDGEVEGDEFTDTEDDEVEGDEFAADTDDTHDEAPATSDDTDKDEAVTAGARRKTRFSGAAKAAGKAPETPPAKGPEFGYRMGRNVHDFKAGFVDTLELAKAMGDMVTGRAPHATKMGSTVSAQFAHFDRPIPADRMVADEVHAEEVLSAATNEKGLPGGSLVAAGGWCAPSETVYDFLGTEAASDLLSVPEIGVKRGGIKFPVEPDFSAIYSEFSGFHQTEAQAQAGEEKTCTEIPCGDFNELRLDVIGLCITNGILADKAWPEQTSKYIDEAMKAHQHRLSKFRIDKIVDGSDEVSLPASFGAAGAVLNGLSMAVQDYRIRHRIPSNTTLEGFAPVWARELLRADLAFRDGKDTLSVSDAEINAWFTQRGVSFQFVVDWQDDHLGGTTPATVWPSEVSFTLYQAGTWYSALEPVINLGVTYDAAMLKQNRRVELFTEDGIAVGKRRNDSRVYTVPVTVDGTVGARNAPAGNGGD